MIPRVMVLVHCTSSQLDIYAYEISSQQLEYLYSYAPDKFKNKNEQRAITTKVLSFELWFLCTALLLNEKNENEQRAITPKV